MGWSSVKDSVAVCQNRKRYELTDVQINKRKSQDSAGDVDSDQAKVTKKG